MKFEQSPSKPSVDTQEYTRALLDQLSEQNNLWKLTLGYLAEKEVGNPLVIPSILTENRAYSAPQASIVAIRVVTNQTSGVSITANGSIYIPVGLSYTQVPTGQLNQISVGGLNDGNKVWVQYLDERAAAMSAAGDGNVVQLTGSLPPEMIVQSGAAVYAGDGSIYLGTPSAKQPVVPNLANGGGAWGASVGTSDGGAGVNIGAIGTYGFNGSSWDKERVIASATGVAATPYSGGQSVAITTATTTAVKGSPGVVGTVINAGSATSGAITIYDNTAASGKIIWSGTLTAGQILPLGMPCGTGITVVTAAANTLVVSYA